MSFVEEIRNIKLQFQVVVGDYKSFDYNTPGLCGVLFQYPNSDGKVIDYTEYIKAAQANKVTIFRLVKNLP